MLQIWLDLEPRLKSKIAVVINFVFFRLSSWIFAPFIFICLSKMFLQTNLVSANQFPCIKNEDFTCLNGENDRHLEAGGVGSGNNYFTAHRVLGEIFFLSALIKWTDNSFPYLQSYICCAVHMKYDQNLVMPHTWLCMMSASTDIPNVAILDLNSTNFLFKPSVFVRGSQSEKSYCLVSDSERKDYFTLEESLNVNMEL